MNYKGFVLLEFEDWKKNFLDGKEVEVEYEIDDEYDEKYEEAFEDYKSEIFESFWEEFFEEDYHEDGVDIPCDNLNSEKFNFITCNNCTTTKYCEFVEEIEDITREQFSVQLDSIEEEKEVYYILDEDGDQETFDFEYEYDRQIKEDKAKIDKYVEKGVF